MPKQHFLLALLLSLFLVNFVSGQEKTEEHTEAHANDSHHDPGHHELKRHVISGSLNHTVIFGGVKEGEASSITLPSFGLNYTYVFSHKWAIGLHNDIILEDFFVKESSANTQVRSGSDDGEIAVIERGTPIAACIMGIYKPIPQLGLMAGFGREFSSHEDFNVIRLGIEVPYHLPRNWELFGVATYDINIDAYQSLTYGIGIGKLF